MLDVMSRSRVAPPEIAGLYVVAYAHADQSVQFEQGRTLNVDGEWLGRVPCLALCTPFNGSEYLVQHCDSNWAPLGVAGGYASAKEAKQALERSYQGVSATWEKQPVPKRTARAAYRAELKAESCSFCGRTPLEFSAVAGKKVRICNHCVDSFHEVMHSAPHEI